MQRGKSRGPRVLFAVILIGVLGYFAVQKLGGPGGGSAFDALSPDTGTSSQNGFGNTGDAGFPDAPDDAPDYAPGAATDEVPGRPGNAVAMTVDYVHDGDTMFLRTDEPNELVPTTDTIKVRLIGIDTPEVGESAECFGEEATELLRTLLPQDSTTWVTVDQGPTDKYGRSLFYLWNDDGLFVNYELVAQGAAESLKILPNDAYYPLLRAAEAKAVESSLGMWGACR